MDHGETVVEALVLASAVEESSVKARIWKETAKGRRVPGTLREVDVPVKYAFPADLVCLPAKEIKPYAVQSRPLYVQARTRSRPLKRKAGNA